MDVVSLYNQALGKVGTRTTVSATNEGSNESNACNVFYDSVRKATLRAAPWNFARKQALLTQLKSSADTPNTVPAPWAYEYAFPNDCLRARHILPQVAASAATINGIPIDSAGLSASALQLMGPPVKFTLGVDNDSGGNLIRVLMTNQDQAQLVYTVDIVDPNLFDSEFVECLTSVLAAKVAIGLTADRELRAELKATAVADLLQARATNGSEAFEVQNSTPDWIRARGTLYDTSMVGFNDFDQLFQFV